MKELTINKNDAGQRLDRFVGKAVPLLPESLLQKYIRLKRIKVNDRGAKRAYYNKSTYFIHNLTSVCFPVKKPILYKG